MMKTTQQTRRLTLPTLIATLAFAVVFTFNACSSDDGGNDNTNVSSSSGTETGNISSPSGGTDVSSSSSGTGGFSSSGGGVSSSSQSNVILQECGTSTYNPATHFCYSNSKVGDFCGSNPQTYNPDLYQCKQSINANGIYLKTPVLYQGENYEAVLIGDQTWMAKNLNYNATGSVCYDNQESNCNTYGRLYNWVTAMALPSSCQNIECSDQIQAKHKGVCPTGWHIPSHAEWTELIRYVDGSTGTSNNYSSPTAGKNLKATSGWNSYSGIENLDTYGFSALPGGSGRSNGGFDYAGDNSYWRSSRESSSLAYVRIMYYSNTSVYQNTYTKYSYFSIRCVKD